MARSTNDTTARRSAGRLRTHLHVLLLITSLASAAAAMGDVATGEVLVELPRQRPAPTGGYLVVLTGLDTSGVEHAGFAEVAGNLAAFHKAETISFDGTDMTELHAQLLLRRPRNVLFVVPPERFDVNLQRRIFMLSPKLDDDPFADFAYGYLTARNGKALAAMWKRIRKLHEAGLPTRTWIGTAVTSGMKSTVYENYIPAIAKAAGFTGEQYFFSEIGSDPDVIAYVDSHLRNIQRASVITMTGNGDPQGIWLFDGRRNLDPSRHWDFEPSRVGEDPEGQMPRITADRVRKLELDGPILWSGTCHSGATCHVYVEGDIVSTFGRSDVTRLYRMSPDESLCLSLIDAGAAALLVPVASNHGSSVSAEADFALLHGASLGETLKSIYDDVFLQTDGRPVLHLFEDGEPHRREPHVMHGAGANRVLIGDPALRPFAATPHPQETVEIQRRDDGASDVIVEWKEGYHTWGWSPYHAPDEPDWRVYARVPLSEVWPPHDPARLRISADAAGADGRAIPHVVRAAFEEFHGERYLHLQASASRELVSYKQRRVTFHIQSTDAAKAETKEPAARQGPAPPSSPAPQRPAGLDDRILWRVPLHAPSFGSGAVADIDNDNKPEIVFGTYFNDEHLYAVNAEDGSLAWKKKSDHGPWDASVLIHDVDGDGRVEILSADSASGRLFCYRGDGSLLWAYQGPACTDSPVSAADVDADGDVELVFGTFARNTTGSVIVLDGASGEVEWMTRVPGRINSEPGLLDVNGDGVMDVLVANWKGDGHLRALDGRNGNELWRFKTDDWIYHGISAADFDRDGRQEVVVADRRGHVWLKAAESGAAQWQARLEGEREGMVFGPTTLLDVDNDGVPEIAVAGEHLHLLGADGHVIWRNEYGGQSISRGAAAADVSGDGTPDLVFATGTVLRAVDGRTGKEHWHIELRGGENPHEGIDSAPLILDADADGRLDVFVVCGKGHSDASLPENYGFAYVVRAGEGAAQPGNQWTCFRGGPRRLGRPAD